MTTYDYDVVMTSPRSIRFEPDVAVRLRSYIARHPGLSGAAVAARFVDEGLRMDEHPGIIFRDGPLGRRAVVVGGPDVWEIVKATRAVRAASPRASQQAVLTLVSESSGVAPRLVDIALSYWAAYPDEVDGQIAEADRAEQLHRDLLERTGRLLSS